MDLCLPPDCDAPGQAYHVRRDGPLGCRTGNSSSFLFARAHPFLLMVSLLLFACSPSHVFALDVPQRRGYVNDYAQMISPSARAKMEAELRAFEQSDSTQLAILTVPSLEGEALEDFSIRVAETWKIGQKGKDNGIILLVAGKERKIRVEVGRGLEGRLTDLMAGRIIDLVFKPRFKRGDFDGGFTAGVHALVDATRGEFKASEKPKRPWMRNTAHLPAIIMFSGIALLILASISRFLGGIAGAVGVPTIAYLASGPISLMALLLLAGAGFAAGLILPLLRHGGGGLSWGGGGWGGGGWGSGGGYSGGGSDFGGGGGDFGGGGASGDW